MPFSNYGLDHLISQELSKLSRCEAPEVTSNFPESKHWVSNFALNSSLGFQVTPEMKRFRFTFLRRAEAAFIEYEYAREALSKYVANRPRKPSLYFRTLHHFEMTIAMLWRAYNFARQFTGVDLYPKRFRSFPSKERCRPAQGACRRRSLCTERRGRNGARVPQMACASTPPSQGRRPRAPSSCGSPSTIRRPCESGCRG